MKPKTLLTFTAILFIAISSSAQEKSPYKFGRVSAEDFQHKVYSIDSNASAVVLADIGSTEVMGNIKGWFSLHFKRYTRIHVLNKNGYDAANVQVYLYKDGIQEEDLVNVKAITYNIENGKVTETKLEKSAIFKDNMGQNWFIKKFTLPNIKEGSILEIQYEINSDYIRNFQSWSFQGENPVLWSEYTASVPQFLNYKEIAQGYLPFFIKKSIDRTGNFQVIDSRSSSGTDVYKFESPFADKRWVMKDVPALRKEIHTSALINHTARIEFQLIEIREPLTYRLMTEGWQNIAKELLEADYFGQQIGRDNNWLADVEKPLLANAKTEMEKAYIVYKYVRDNFTCTNHSSLTLSQNLKTVLKNRSGNEAELNLLLTVMLRYANIQADPVILSTKSHGYINPSFPLINKFNYVISNATINGRPYYFDASVPRLGFGKLMTYCYNGQARIVNEDIPPVDFNADSLLERTVTSMFFINDENGDLQGTMQQTLGSDESLTLRNRIKEKGNDDVVKDIRKSYSQKIEIKTPIIDSVNKPEENIGIKYELTFKPENDDILYFEPLLSQAYKENPFKAAQRYYPVEMPFTIDDFFILNMEVPKGYTVDELPQSVRMKLNEEGDGMFEYVIQQQADKISLRSRIILKRTYYTPEEYEMLREFYNMIVKKHSEQIVFKKKK